MQYRYANARNQTDAVQHEAGSAAENQPYPDTRLLVAALREQTPPELQYLIDDGFDRIVLYDNKAVSATSKKTADAVGAAAQAAADVAFYRDKMLGHRDWWRVAETCDGEPVGFTVPSRNSDHPVVGYLGVLPEHRGHGYIDDILAETTRILAAAADAKVIHADTDLANRPMAAAFERAGYQNFGHRVVLSAP